LHNQYIKALQQTKKDKNTMKKYLASQYDQDLDQKK